MLSLLSLIIASGSVLRESKPWDPAVFPDPRINATECKVIDYSTLCDPDHLLTDNWRNTIRETIDKHSQKFAEADIPYVTGAEERCLSNISESAQIFVILAKRIQAASEHSITSNDMIKFGDGLRDTYGLESQLCKNYVLILGVELAKEIYVWTGSDLALTKEQVDSSLSQFKNVFSERNYTEGINQIVDEIGELLLNPNRDSTTTELPTTEAITEEETTVSTSTSPPPVKVVPSWIYVVIGLLVLAVVVLSIVALLYIRKGMRRSIHPLNPPDGKLQHLRDSERGSRYNSNIQKRNMSIIPSDSFRKTIPPREDPPKSPVSEESREEERSIGSRSSLQPETAEVCEESSTEQEHVEHLPTVKVSGPSYFSSSENVSVEAQLTPREKKLTILPQDLTTDIVLARRHSETVLHPVKMSDQFSSF